MTWAKVAAGSAGEGAPAPAPAGRQAPGKAPGGRQAPGKAPAGRQAPETAAETAARKAHELAEWDVKKHIRSQELRLQYILDMIQVGSPPGQIILAMSQIDTSHQKIMEKMKEHYQEQEKARRSPTPVGEIKRAGKNASVYGGTIELDGKRTITLRVPYEK